MTAEPFTTALLLSTAGVLLGVSVVFGHAAERVRMPVVLVFLLIGMLAGSDGIGGIAFEDYRLAYQLATAALVMILFDGGLNTPRASVMDALRPAGVLATAGVFLTAVIVALGARLLGLSWPTALLFGAVTSSTDAAAVFSILRSGGVQLKRRVGVTLEVESGVNDPMAVILTTVLVRNLAAPAEVSWTLVPLQVLFQLAVGAAAGFAVGHGGRLVMARLRLAAGGLYVALSLALAFLAFGIPTLLQGSGFLAVYVAGVILGNGHLPYRSGLLRAHDAFAWLAQIAMFLMLGLLVFPSRLLEVAGLGLGLAFVLTFVARPIAVALCLWPWHFRLKEVLYIGWVGLRGAVPIVLATFPVFMGTPGAERLFSLVFFVVVVSVVLQGGTIAWVTRRLGLESGEAPPPAAAIEIASLAPLEGAIRSFHVDAAVAAAGERIRDLPFPDGARVMLIVRDRELVPPKGTTALQPGDHVFILSRPEDEGTLSLIFGRAAADA
jgi:cell volume regulation protein A